MKRLYTIVLYNIAFACNQTSMDLMTEELNALCYNTLHNIMFVAIQTYLYGWGRPKASS